MAPVQRTGKLWDIVFSSVSDLSLSVILKFFEAASDLTTSGTCCVILFGTVPQQWRVHLTPRTLTVVPGNHILSENPTVFCLGRQPTRKCFLNMSLPGQTPPGSRPPLLARLPVQLARQPKICLPVPIPNQLRKLSSPYVVISFEETFHGFSSR